MHARTKNVATPFGRRFPFPFFKKPRERSNIFLSHNSTRLVTYLEACKLESDSETVSSAMSPSFPSMILSVKTGNVCNQLTNATSSCGFPPEAADDVPAAAVVAVEAEDDDDVAMVVVLVR